MFKYFLNFIIQKFKKRSMWLPAPSVCKWNEIKKIVLSVKLYAKMHFLQDPQKANISHSNHFLYVLPKKTYKQTFTGNWWLLFHV